MNRRSCVRLTLPRWLRRRSRARIPHKHAATRVFQAIRIHINEELDEVRLGLEAAFALIRSGGRIAVLTFHSLEDRIVKQAFRRWAEGDANAATFAGDGPRTRRWRVSSGAAQRASAAEVADESARAKCAVARAGEGGMTRTARRARPHAPSWRWLAAPARFTSASRRPGVWIAAMRTRCSRTVRRAREESESTGCVARTVQPAADRARHAIVVSERRSGGRATTGDAISRNSRAGVAVSRWRHVTVVGCVRR